MSEPVNNPGFGGIVGRHLHPHAIAHRQANEPFAHFARNMREHEMLVRERDSKHRSGQHARDRSLQLDRLFRVRHHCRFSRFAKTFEGANSAALI
jgi:hypothetical protein